MIISIASGKGGTGKTTVATNLAFSIKEKVRLLDCDVEAPNSHLFLNPEIDETREVFSNIPQVNEELCTYCKKCMDICRFNAIAVMGKKKVMTFPDLCHDCGGCVAVCPENAITEVPKVLGSIELGHTGDINFAHGRLAIGQAMAPPIIKKIRQLPGEEAVTIIDAPPGTSCPVIAAMNGADFALLVTEPTPFGLHDLSLAVDAVRVLGLQCGIVINRSTLGNDCIHKYAQKENVPILMEIPFDKEIARSYSKGEMIVHAFPEYKSKFQDLFEQIKTLAAKKAGAA